MCTVHSNYHQLASIYSKVYMLTASKS